MTSRPVRLVAFANGTYSKLAKLERSVQDAQDLAKILGQDHEYETFVFPDIDFNGMQLAVKQKLGNGALTGGTLILSWTGHGVVSANGTLRLLGTFDDEDVELTSAAQLGEWAALTGALQILVLLDTCSSGAGVIDAAELAKSIIEQRASRSSAWFGVVAASLADQPALSGALSRELQQILRNGPKNPDLRWDRKREYIRGDDLIQAIRDNWSEHRQNPQILATSSRAWDLVRNPLFERGLPDQVVEHLLQAAHGHSGTENFFTGRHSALRRIVTWIGSRKPGLFVLTGPPGSGKSAILGRVLSLSSREERERILHLDTVAAELDPQEGSVDGHIQARGVTIDIAAEELLRRLSLDPADGRFGLLSAAERRRKAGDPLVLAIDGLDEAGAIGREMAAEFLKPLAQQCLLIVATRDVQSYGEESLIATLGPSAELLDLGDEEGTSADIHDYVVCRLRDVDPTMDPSCVADEIVAKDKAGAPFLFARLVTSQLRERPVNTSIQDWQLTLSATVESALERDLQSVVLQINGQARPTAAREMLRALTLAYGSGFPADDVWPAIASAISETGTIFTRDDAYHTLRVLGRHLVAGSESGQAVYRLAHQRLVEYLTSDSLGAVNPKVLRERRKATALAISDLYNEFLDSGFLPVKHQYLWRYAWRHLAEGGEEGLKRLRELAERDRDAFLPDLASGLEIASALALSAGLVEEAAKQLTESVELWRQLKQTSRLSLALFKLAMVHLATGDLEGADAAATEASAVAEQLPESSGSRRMAALTLLGRACTQLAEGQYLGAKLLAGKASSLGGSGEGATDPDGRELHAFATLVAAKASGALGDWGSAVALCQESVDLMIQYGNPETDEDFTNALASLILTRIGLASTQSKGGKEPALPASCEAGVWLLEGSARWSGDSSLKKINVNRGLVGVVQAKLIDEASGIDISHLSLPGLEVLPALLDRIIQDIGPLAATMIDAAWAYATALFLRASLRKAGEEQLAERERSLGIDILRPFSETSPFIAATLGSHLYISVSKDLLRLTEHLGNAGDLAARLAESLSLLRKGGSLVEAVLASAVTKVACIWQVAGRADLQKASTAEAVAELRDLVGRTPEAASLLAISLSDLAALNVDNPILSEQLAGEALVLAQKLRPSAEFSWILAVSELNVSVAKSLLRKSSEACDLLKSAIIKIETSTNALRPRVLATAYANLAVMENRVGNYARALDLSRIATSYFAEPTLYPFVGAENLFLARLAEGIALQHVGPSQLGDALVDKEISDALDDYHTGKVGLSRLAGILNEIGPKRWDDFLASLSDNPGLFHRLRIHRLRPADEIALAVTTLVEELAIANPSEAPGIRAVARSHRSFSPELFDTAWQMATGEVPAWLKLDLNTIGSAFLWVSCTSLLSSRSYLEEHPALLLYTTDPVLDEFQSAGASEDFIDLLRQILSKARRSSVKEAYAPLLAADLVQEWLQDASPIEYLSRNSALINIDVVNYVNEMASQNDELFGPIAGILELAQRNELGILREIENAPSEIFKYLQFAWRSKDVKRLAALASVVRGVSDDASQRSKATAALAVARVLEGRENEGRTLIAEATQKIGSDKVQDLFEILGDSIAHHQSFAQSFADLIRIITDVKSTFATP